MNVELLEKVKAHIRAEPGRLDMKYGLKRDDSVPCNTVGCIAGWSVVLSTPGIGNISSNVFDYVSTGALRRAPMWVRIRDKAIDQILDIHERNQDEYLDAIHNLFNLEEWPIHFKLRYEGALSPNQRAEITCQAIDSFIANPLDWRYQQTPDMSRY